MLVPYINAGQLLRVIHSKLPKADVELGMTGLCYFVIPQSPPDPKTSVKKYEYCRGEVVGNLPVDDILMTFLAQVSFPNHADPRGVEPC